MKRIIFIGCLSLTFTNKIFQDSIQLNGVLSTSEYYKLIIENQYGKNCSISIFVPNYYLDLQEVINNDKEVAKVTGISKRKLNLYFKFWRTNDYYLWNADFPDYNRDIINKSLEQEQTPIAVSGLMILPEGFIITVLRIYCKGLCMTKRLLIFKKTQYESMHLVKSKIIDVT